MAPTNSGHRIGKELPNSILTPFGVPAPNPLLERLLPSVLFIGLASLLGEALDIYLDTEGLKLPRRDKNDLYHKVKFLAETGALDNGPALHELRSKRKDLAHESDYHASWLDLDNALDAVERALRQLGLADRRPKYEFYSERSQARESSEPGVAFAFDHCYGLKEGGQKVIEVSWTSAVHQD